MNELARNRVRQVIAAHMRSAEPQCQAARTVLLSWLEPGSQAWIFETHAADNGAAGAWILGQTAHIHGKPAGFGLRAAVFTSADNRTLARVALHEGAHLAGADEAGAVAVDNLCASA